MNRSLTALSALAGFAALLSCAPSRPAAPAAGQPAGVDPVLKPLVVGTAGTEKILLSDLARDWRLGVPAEQKISEEALKEFLPLYTDFRLKVLEAKAAGYDRDSAIVNELRGYQLQFAVPYWFQKELEAELVNELVERSKSQVKVSHILISVPDNASYSDTARVYEKLLQARQAFLDKKSTWEELDGRYSSRQSGRSMGGPLGYIDAGWAVKPFEDVAFSTPVGAVSMPFRTRFGYHIILVEDRRPALPPKKYSHIFFRVSNLRDTTEIRSVLNRAGQVYKALEKGTAWDSLVVQHSDDQFSVKTGGSIGWVDYSKGFRPQFIDTVMSMDRPGTFRKPFFSSYGVHIMRLDSVQTPLPLEKQKESWQNKLKQLDRYSDSRQTVFDRIRKIGRESVPPQSFTRFQLAFRPQSPSTVGAATLPDSIRSMVMYTLNGTSYTAAQFWAHIHPRYDAEPFFENLQKYFEEFKNQAIESEMIRITGTRFKEFAELSDRYLNGLMVYAITEDSVWEYARTAEARLKALYATQPQDYWFGIRYKFRRFSCGSDSLAAVITSRIKSGTLPADSLNAGLRDVVVETGELSSFDEEPFNRLTGLTEGQFTPVFEFRQRRNILLLESVLPPVQMTYDEASFKLVSDYQRIREQEWLQGLRRKYSVLLKPEAVKL